MSTIKPFFIDYSARAATIADGNRRKLWLQQLVLLWNNSEVTSGYPISSLETVRHIIQTGPKEYIDGRIDRKKSETVTLPVEFNDIRRYAEELRHASLDDFVLKSGSVEFSPRFYYKQISRVYFFAVTPAQVKRLRYAEALAKQVDKQKEFFIEECQAAGISPGKQPFRYSPVPTGVRLDYVNGAHRPVVDPQWVARGYAATNHTLEEVMRTASVEPFGNYRIAYSENDMVLLDGDSAPQGYTVLSGHYEFAGHVCRQRQSNLERILTAIN